MMRNGRAAWRRAGVGARNSGRSLQPSELAASAYELYAGEQRSSRPAHEALDASLRTELAVGALVRGRACSRSSEPGSREAWRLAERAAPEQGERGSGGVAQERVGPCGRSDGERDGLGTNAQC